MHIGVFICNTYEAHVLVVCESIRCASTVLVIKKFPVDDIVWRLVWVVSTICMYVAQNFN